MSEVYYKTALVGGSGSGKTMGFRNMDRDKTLFINVENKPLPFKGAFKNTIVPETVDQVLEAIKEGSKNPAINSVVIDSFSAFLDLNMSEARKTKKGFDIYNHYNENIGKFNDYVKRCKKEVFVTAHYEVLQDELSGTKEKRVKVNGKAWEGVWEKDYTIVLYVESKPTQGGKPVHTFKLVNDGTNSAKCPPDIFGEDVLSVDNDAKLVFDKIQEFKK
jgi:hypothetical protein